MAKTQTRNKANKTAAKAGNGGGGAPVATAVAAAVAAQLHHEGRWPPNDLTKTMGSDYHYDANTIVNFLLAVQWHLAHGNPPYAFDFDAAFAQSALQRSVAALMVAIAGQTS